MKPMSQSSITNITQDDYILSSWDFENMLHVPPILRDVIISKGIDIDAMPAQLQVQVAHAIAGLWIDFEKEVINKLSQKDLIPEKWAVHWRMYLKSDFNKKFLELYPELRPMINQLTLKFVA